MSQRPTAILIIGAHRSGTSALAKVLTHLGVDFGNPENFISPELFTHNPNGFFELRWVNALNDEIFAHLGTSWKTPSFISQNRFQESDLAPFTARIQQGIVNEFGSGSSLIGLKDPRISILLPLWRDPLLNLGYQIKCLLIFRHPLGFAASVKRINDSLSTEEILADWLHHNLSAINSTRSIGTMLVNFDRMVAHPEDSIAPVASWLGVPRNKIREAAAGVEPDSYHHHYEDESSSNRFVDRVYRALKNPKERSTLISMYETVVDLYPLLEAYKNANNLRPQPVENFLQVFWLSQTGYSEANSARLTIQPDAEFHEYAFRLPGTSLTRLRLDPGNRPGLVRIKSITLHRPGEEFVIRSCSSKDGFTGLEAGPGVAAFETGDICSLASIGDDPQLYLDFTPPDEGSSDVELRIVMSFDEAASSSARPDQAATAGFKNA